MNQGDVRELADLPDGGAVGLTMATDGSAVGICFGPALGDTETPRMKEPSGRSGRIRC